MTRSLRLMIMLVIGLFSLAAVAAAVLFVVYGTGGPSQPADGGSTPGFTNSSTVVTNATVTTNVTSTNVNESSGAKNASSKDLETMAVYFTERFGSYSNHSDSVYQNIEELYIYMTDSMRTWAEKFVADARAKEQNKEEYFGVTTKALAPRLVSFDDTGGTAEFVISTQRKENTNESGEPKLYYQDITIRFLKVDGVWKVNEARWQ